MILLRPVPGFWLAKTVSRFHSSPCAAVGTKSVTTPFGRRTDAFVFHENLDRRIDAGFGLITLGALLLSWSGRNQMRFDLASLLLVGACLCWGIDNNLTRKVSGGDPVLLAAVKGLVAGTMNASLACLTGSAWSGAFLTSGAMLLGFVSYGLSLVFFIVALRYLGAARTGAYFATAPFMGTALAVILLPEPVTFWLVIAGGFMAAGGWLHVTEHHEHRHRHALMTHDHLHWHDEAHQHTHSQSDPPGEPHSRTGITTKNCIHSHSHYPDIHHQHRH